MKKIFQFFLFGFFFSFIFSPFAAAQTLGVFEQFQKSSVILKAEVKSFENFNQRPDWQIISLKTKEVYKGSVASELRFFHPHYFSTQTSIYSVGKEVLVFLKPLSSYTSYETLKQAGIGYEVLSDESILLEKQDQSSFVAWLKKQQALLATLSDPSQKQVVLQTLFLDFLNASYSSRLQGSLSQDLMLNSFAFDFSSSLPLIKQKLLEASVDSLAKAKLLEIVLKLPADQTNSILKDFFCISPAQVCLKTARTLEERGQKIELQNYQKAFQSADSKLKVDLLSILGKTKRLESFSLFSSYLKTEKDPKNIAQALEALSGLSNSQKAFELMMGFANYPQIDVKIAFAGWVGEFKKEAALPVLENYLKTRDPSLVLQTANSLQKIGTPKATALLYKYYEKGHHGHWEPIGTQQKHDHFLPKVK